MAWKEEAGVVLYATFLTYSSVCKCVFVVQLVPVFLEQQVEWLFDLGFCHLVAMCGFVFVKW